MKEERPKVKIGVTPMEIERKFLIKKLPKDLSSYPYHEIEQGYLCTSPVVRIRRQDNEYILTYKANGMMIRDEYNLPLTETSYLHLREKIDGNLISKRRYIIPIENGLKIELDLFHPPFQDLILAEVEFPTEEAANTFIPPSWFMQDVTFMPEYHNSYLSRQK